LRAAGPPLPDRLASIEDLTALDLARESLLCTPAPPGFESELSSALDALEQTASVGTGIPERETTYAVRSSGEREDRAGTLGAGIYASLLRVPRAQVPGAVRQVLASFLTPAAWVYGLDWSGPPRAQQRPETSKLAGAVLIHVFVAGEASGTAALFSDSEAAAVRIDTSTPTLARPAQARIQAAARASVAAAGPSELEWVATGEAVTFLQWRPYRPAPAPASAADASLASIREPDGDKQSSTDSFAEVMGPSAPGGAWTWDAVHNPLPLSPAQAGLVELVDANCPTRFRQRVVNGYLFYRSSSGATPPGEGPEADPRAAFELLRADLEPRLDALGAEPSLEAALGLFVAAYTPLYGKIGPACVAARQALAELVARRFPEQAHDLPARLLSGVSSAATARRLAVAEIAGAASTARRQAAVHTYLLRFGDESPRWDVAEPTLRERPERLLLLATATGATGRAEIAAAPDTELAATTRECRDRLSPDERTVFDTLLCSARGAVALGEDDDALYARLQTAVRRALLAVARRLVSSGKLDEVDDVFYLPLSTIRLLGDGSGGPPPQGTTLPPPAVGDGSRIPNLRPLVVSGRRAFGRARQAPPPVPGEVGARVVRGQSGSGGRALGRAVHHPPSAPLGGDAILIAGTLLPTELPLLWPGALVIESGGPLGHVAAQARERGIPAVVGAAGALAAIPEGALILVDGDRGEIVHLDG